MNFKTKLQEDFFAAEPNFFSLFFSNFFKNSAPKSEKSSALSSVRLITND